MNILPDDKCPVCDKTLNAVTTSQSSQNPMPAPGDVSVCAGCGSILEFDENLRHRLLSQESFNQLEYDTKRHLLSYVQYVKGRQLQ